MIAPQDPITLQGLIVSIIVSYLLGALPFGLLAARLFQLGDVRKIGSGNIGATNVLRTGNKSAALFTLIGDMVKGAIAVLLARYFFGDTAAQVAALAAILGHCYPVWLNFKGGKGVATFLGIMLALHFPVGIACCLSWLAGAYFTRISSAAALIAAGSSILWLIVFSKVDHVALGLVLFYIIIYKHRENIDRLFAGAEPKIGKKK